MNDLTILVVSCDKYADLWPVFIELFERNWKDCPWPLFFGSNYRKSNLGYKTILIGEDSSWCDNVKKMLEDIESKYVLLLLEDFFLDRFVDSKRVKECFEWMKRNDFSCLRLEPAPPPSETIDKKLGIGRLHVELPYYVSTQPAIWEKTVLKKLLKSGYSAWDFELKNSQDATEEYGKFAATNKAVIHHKNGVERGKLYSSVVKFLMDENIDITNIKRDIIYDESIREVLSAYKYKLTDLVRAKFLYKWKIRLRKK